MDCGNEIMAREVLPGAVGDFCDIFFFFEHTGSVETECGWAGGCVAAERWEIQPGGVMLQILFLRPQTFKTDSLLLPFTPCVHWSSAPVFRFEPAVGWSKATLESFDSGTIKFKMCPLIPASSHWIDNLRSQEGRESLLPERWWCF